MQNRNKYESELNDILEDTGVNNFFSEMEEYDSHNFGKDQYQDLNKNFGLDTRKIANNANEYDTYLRDTINDSNRTRKPEVNREMYERILEETIARTQMAEMEKKQKDEQRRKQQEIENTKRKMIEQKMLEEQRRLREEEYKIEIARRNNQFQTTPRRSQASQNNNATTNFEYMNTTSHKPVQSQEPVNERVQVKHNPRDVIDDKKMEELIEATRKFFVHTQLIEERIEKINQENKSLEKRQTGHVRLTIIILSVIAVALIIAIVIMTVGKQ